MENRSREAVLAYDRRYVGNPVDRIRLAGELQTDNQRLIGSLAEQRRRVAELEEEMAENCCSKIEANQRIANAQREAASVFVPEIESLRVELGCKDEEIEKLQAFKDYVHKRLDEAGIDRDPESTHKAEGCRIGGRLDILMSQRNSCADIVNTIKGYLPPAAFANQRLNTTDAVADWRKDYDRLTAANAELQKVIDGYNVERDKLLRERNDAQAQLAAAKAGIDQRDNALMRIRNIAQNNMTPGYTDIDS